MAELRYTAYLDNNSIGENSDQIFYDQFDLRSNCHSHIEYIDNMPAAAIRACVLDPKEKTNAIPAMEIFAKEIEEVTKENDVILETNKFVIHPSFQRKGLRLKFELFSYIFKMAYQVNANYIIVAVRRQHAKFYKCMNFFPISDVKQYPGLNFGTVLLLHKFNTGEGTYLDLSDKIKTRLNINAIAA